MVQQEILGFLVTFLHQIEWRYGENRAPIKYPPDFSIVINQDGSHSYVCMIETDFGEPEERIHFSSDSVDGLIEGVKLGLIGRFGRNFE